MIEADGNGERGGLGRKAAADGGAGLVGVVDVGDAAVGVGVDEAANLLGEVDDVVGIAGRVTGDVEGAVGIKDVAADVALAVEDLQASGGAIDSDADHDAAIELAGRDGAVGEGVLRGTCSTAGRRTRVRGRRRQSEGRKGSGQKITWKRDFDSST